MFAVVVDGIRSFDPARSTFWIVAGVEIAIEAREIATGDFQPQAMSGKKDVAGGPHVDIELVDISWLHELRLLLGGAIARPQDSIGQIPRISVRPDINHLSREVRVHRG